MNKKDLMVDDKKFLTRSAGRRRGAFAPDCKCGATRGSVAMNAG